MINKLLRILLTLFSIWASCETFAETYKDGWLTYTYYPSSDTDVPEASVSKISWVTNTPKHIIIPEHIEIDNVLYAVTSIGDNAADRLSAGIDSISIPNTVKVIGEYAFYKSYIRYVKIGKGVVNIKNNAFKECQYLKAVEIEDLEAWCNIDFGSFLSGGAWSTSDMTYYENANPLRWGNHLYINGHLVEELVIPESITKIKKCAFVCGFFKNIIFHENITGIGDSAFKNAEGLETLDLSNSSVWGIGEYAFSQISTLKYIKFSKNIGSISIGAFASDDNVVEIWCPATQPPYAGFTSTTEPFYYSEYNKYNSTYNKATLYIPQGCMDSYKSASIWSKFQHIEEDESLNSSIDECYKDNYKIFSRDTTIFINGITNEIIRIFDLSGKQIYMGTEFQIHVPCKGVYFIVINQAIHKVSV